MRYEINCQKTTRVTNENPGEIQVTFSEEKMEQVTLGSVKIKVKNSSFFENKNLRMEHPVRIWMETEQPKRMTAFYMYNAWWTRPAFLTSFEQMPERTQVLLLDYEDHYRCLLPMVGNHFKSRLIPGTEKELCFEMLAGVGGQSMVDEPLYLYADGSTVYEAVRLVFSWLTAEKGIRPRKERRVPEMFGYLGWCSWNAFYRDMNEELILQKAEEFREKQIPIQWMLIDDGWLSAEEDDLCDFIPDTAKFPKGFGPMVEQMKKEDGIRWVGVWHALAGFWNGVRKGSKVYQEEKDCLYEVRNGKILPSPYNGSRFYMDWYKELYNEGIRFVKVDGQSSAAYYFENSEDLCETANGLSLALEQGASRMDGAVINCMGMAMENILARPTTALSRNSDDFVPEKEGSFVEHLMQNAYNSLYHNEIYCCDWDMFWSTHEDAVKHSILRAVSGGPIYVSDKLGESDREVLKPLAYADGKIPLLARSAKPTADCIFTDPRKDGVLKLHNYGSYGQDPAGVIAVYNLTDTQQTFSFSSADIPELDPEKEYLVYDYLQKKAVRLKAGETYPAEMEASACGLYWLVPASGKITLLGLTDKYAGFRAVESLKETPQGVSALLHASGTICWLAEEDCKEVLVDGVDRTAEVRKEENYYCLELPETAGPVFVILR